MAGLAIRLFGGFSVAIDGVPVSTIQPGRQQVLLAYLLLHRGAPIARRHLAFLLWPESSDAQAQANLRQLLHHLRRALPAIDRYLQLESRTIEWRATEPFELDVAVFEREAGQAAAAARTGDLDAMRRALDAAVESYGGDLLPECYEEWLLQERERWREHFIATLDQLIVLLEENRDYPAAIQHAQQLLRQDPLHETTYRRLMALQAANGERAAALRTYHACATVLMGELGVEPQAATQGLYTRLLEMIDPPQEPSTPGSSSSRLVGRRAEWARLQAVWREVMRGGAQAVVIYGVPGIGKSRLLEEMQHWGGQQGATIAHTRTYAAEGALAYAPVIDWLRSPGLQSVLPMLEPSWHAEVARLLPELSTPETAARRASERSERLQRLHLHEALARTVLGARPPLLLVIDDLQWCDQETLEWLHFLMRSARDVPLMLLGAARAEELDERHPLHSFLIAQRIAGKLTELELGPLTPLETSELAAQVAGRRLSNTAINDLSAASEGSPLFVVELVRDRLEDAGDAMRGAPSRQAPTRTSTRTLPSRLHAVIEARLNQLTFPARELAAVAAVCGRMFTFELVARAIELDESALVRALDELWRRRLIREQATTGYDFSHDAIREVAYAAMGPAWRRQLHGRVADALQHVHARDLNPVSAELAVHYLQAGQTAPAITWYRRAAEVAAERFDHKAAAGYLRSALALLSTRPAAAERTHQEFTLLSALIGSLVVTEGFSGPQISKVFERIADIVDQLQDERLRYAALRDLRWYCSAIGRMDKSLMHAERLMDLALQFEERDLLIEAHAALGIVHRYQGRQTLARKHLGSALAIIGVGQSPSANAPYHSYSGIEANLALTLWLLGYPDQACTAAARALIGATALGKPFDLHIAQFFASVLYRHMRDVARMSELIGPFSEIGRQYDIRIAYFDELSIQGWLEAMEGRFAPGIAKMRKGIDEFNALGHRQFHPHRLTLLLEAQVRGSDLVGAAATLQEALSLSTESGEHGWDAELHRLRAELLCAEQARPDEIRAAYEQSITIARSQKARSLELRATTGLCRYLQRQRRDTGERERLARLFAWFTEGFDTPDLREAKELLASAAS